MQKRAFIWSLTGVSTLLGFMLTVQFSSHPKSSADSLSSYLDLRDQVQEQMAENQALEQEIAKQNALLLQYQSASGQTNEMLHTLQQDAKAVEEAAGTTSVSGPGITIKIQFDPTLPYDPKYSGLFEQTADQELGQIVNWLFANGAQAISINGQRLVTTSSIRLVGGLDPTTNILQINTNPVTSPYVITAMGDINRMQAILTVNNVQTDLNLMQEDCIIQAHPGAHGVTVPGYTGQLPGHWAKEVNQG
ncbi:hypothetical protein GCM10025857_05170 [Alicyclobacillus contaminans]|uniref:DUF881 domain-containing protein n=1 Tax=Alicyclobacillus contaminans TaxID=392016 RepID=UPI0004047631|nr:DUF881 domain-containing protein [Alicyclobacillus contaminans]GMA49160.1 hypothetical protein GCM10025857_05170 [Alicyclobacillus contaminans]